ncbi:MAG: VOC family protein [Armatimonadota bacterium]|nr:VOC family protein [Armatimonadota bacterium]MDR5696168.1 VOC family protein [Armatimonadota bacterium]
MRLPPNVDHLVYASPDLDRGIAEIEGLLGVQPSAGGQHIGIGTRNALVGLGPMTYLEIIAPDPDQPPPLVPRPFGIDQLCGSKLAAWFLRASDLGRLRGEALRAGVPIGGVKSASRRRPDGVALSWEMTDPWCAVAEGIVPFFIDWKDSPHPAATAPRGGSWVGLRAEHPDAPRVRDMLSRLGIEVPVEVGPLPALIATIEGARGRVELK